jgi:hypothetical protein
MTAHAIPMLMLMLMLILMAPVLLMFRCCVPVTRCEGR